MVEQEEAIDPPEAMLIMRRCGYPTNLTPFPGSWAEQPHLLLIEFDTVLAAQEQYGMMVRNRQKIPVQPSS